MNNLQLFRELRRSLQNSPLPEELYCQAYKDNEWFDRENINCSLKAVIDGLLNDNCLVDFIYRYGVEEFSTTKTNRSVAIIMAGNIPFVGAADILYSLLCSYNKIYIKYSSKDRVTMVWFVERIKEALSKCSYIDVEITQYDSQKVDHAIATGSDNSSRYFRHIFAECSCLIRSNRSSLALITENSSDKDIDNLWDDIFLRYGQGCRNITQVFLHKDVDIEKLVKIWKDRSITNNHFINVYRQHKAILTMQKVDFHDLGYAVIVENSSLFAPLSQINVTRYENRDSFKSYVDQNSDKLQCIIEDKLEFGRAQFPTLFDYADGIDVMKFLTQFCF